MNFLKTTLLTVLATVAVAQTCSARNLERLFEAFASEHASLIEVLLEYGDSCDDVTVTGFAESHMQDAGGATVFATFDEALQSAINRKESSFIAVQSEEFFKTGFAENKQHQLAARLQSIQEANAHK